MVIKINQFHFSIIKSNKFYNRNDFPLDIKYVKEKRFHYITNKETENPSWYNSIIKEKFFTHSKESLNNSDLKHEAIYYLKYRIQKLQKKKGLNNITKNTINQHSFDWVRGVIKKFDFYKDNKYVNWNLNLYEWSNQTNKKLERSTKIVISGNKYLKIMSNQMEFFTNRNLISWSGKLKKNYSKFYFICQNFIKKGFYFSIFNKSENYNTSSYSPKIFDTKNIYLETNSSSYKNELSQEFNFSSDQESIVPLSLNEIPVSNFTIDSFSNKLNFDVEYMELSDDNTLFTIFKNQDIWFDPVKFSNKSLRKTYFNEAIIPKFLDHLHHIQLNYNKRWFFYFCNTKENIIKDSKLTYGQLLNILPQHNNIFISSFLGIGPFSSEEKAISVTQSQIFNIFFKCLKISYNQTIALVNNSYKLLNLLTRIHLVFHKKINTYFIEEFSTITLLTRKQIVNLEITYYNQPDIEISTTLERRNANNLLDEKTLGPNLSLIQRQSYQHDLLSESSLKIQNKNNKMFYWVRKMFVRNSSTRDSKNITRNKVIDGKNTELVLFENSNRLKEIKENKTILSFFLPHSNERTRNTGTSRIFQFQIDSFLKKNALFEMYTPWFFTFKWWKYLYNIILQTFTEILLNSSDQFEYVSRIHVQDKEISNNQPNKSLLEFIWSYFKSTNFWNNEFLIFISFFLPSFLFLQNYLSNLLGSDYIDLWKRFEIFQYLIENKSYWNKLMYQHPVQLIDTQNTFINFLKKFRHYIKNRKLFLFTIEKPNRWLANNKSLDIFIKKRDFLIQSFVTQKKISRYGLSIIQNHYLRNNNFGYQITQQGLYYLRYLAESFEKSLVNYPFYQFNLTQKWVFLAFWQRITSPHISRQTKTLNFTPHGIPIPLRLGLYPSKGNLLIGPIETGRSYLIKNLAADSYVPLIQISISNLVYNAPDITTKDWNVLMENMHQLALILELTKEMSPCIIWIQNIHELNTNYSTQDIKSTSTSLLGLLLRYFRTNFVNNRTFSIIVFGSTHIPEVMDPSLIYPNRLDNLINIRILNISQRQKEFSIFLRSKRFHLENYMSCLNEFGYGTMGYDARDLALLVNEISLINITYNKSVIYGNTIGLAFHRQALGFTYTDMNTECSQNDEKLIYEIGKAIVRNIVTKKFTMNPLCKGNNFWKKRFYYLSEWYLEPHISETTIKEFTILSHILGCLAGSAARDSWFGSKNKQENLIPLDKNDSNSACTILESLLVEFPKLEIYEDESLFNEKALAPYSQTTNLLNIMQKTIFPTKYKQKVYNLVSNTACSPRIWRFSLIRSNIFNRIKRPNEFRIPYYVQSFLENEQTPSKYLQNNFQAARFVQYKMKQQSPYNRVLSKMKQISLEELESQLEITLLKEQFETLGIFSSIQYPIECQISNKPLLFMGKRFIWDSTGLLLRNNHLAFSHRKLFVDEEMLRRLFVTYGTKREQKKLQSIQKIEQFFVHRGYSQDSMSNLSISGLNQLTFVDKQNIESFKSTEQFGVQLKHPHLFAAIYLYQPWLIEYPQEKSVRFESLNNDQRKLEVNSSLSSDLSLHSTLFESHQYLLNSFCSNRMLFNQIKKLLLKNRWLFQNEIETSLILENRNN